MSLHATDVYHYWHQTIRSQAVAALCSLVGAGSLAAIPMVPYKYQIVPGLAALLAGIAGQVSSETYQDNRRILGVGKLVSEDQWRNRMYNEMDDLHIPTQQTTELTPLTTGAYKPSMYDWSDILPDGDKFKHVIILGATGDGKTTTLTKIFQYVGGYQLVMTPHWKPGDFEGIKVVGKGRNYGSMEDATPRPLYKLLDPKYDKYSLADGHISLLQEMNQRYSLYESGSNSPMFNIGLDEFRTQVSNLPAFVRKATNELPYVRVPGAGEIIKDLLQEARKVFMRLFILAHDQTVKSLGMEGEGGMRNSFVWVRLGQFAIDNAWDLLKEERITQQDYAWLKAQQYPMMVGDLMASLDDIPVMHYGEHEPKMVRPDTAVVVKAEDTTPQGQATPVQLQGQVGRALDGANPSGNILGDGVVKDNVSSTKPIAPIDPIPQTMQVEVPSILSVQESVSSVPQEEAIAAHEPISTLMPSKVVRQAFWQALKLQCDQGLSQSQVIKNSLGIKPGSSYQTFKKYWAELENEFGVLHQIEEGLDDIPE